LNAHKCPDGRMAKSTRGEQTAGSKHRAHIQLEKSEGIPFPPLHGICALAGHFPGPPIVNAHGRHLDMPLRWLKRRALVIPALSDVEPATAFLLRGRCRCPSACYCHAWRAGSISSMRRSPSEWRLNGLIESGAAGHLALTDRGPAVVDAGQHEDRARRDASYLD
jgi:hypothetical protein